MGAPLHCNTTCQGQKTEIKEQLVIGHGNKICYTYEFIQYIRIHTWHDSLKPVTGVSDDGQSSSPDLTANQTSDGSEDPLDWFSS